MPFRHPIVWLSGDGVKWFPMDNIKYNLITIVTIRYQLRPFEGGSEE